MKLTRTITILLLTGLLLPTLAACGSSGEISVTAALQSTTTTTATPTAPPVTTAGVPEREYPAVQPLDTVNFAKEGFEGDGLIVSVGYVEGTKGTYTRRSLQADEQLYESIDQKTLERNQLLSQQTGLQLKVAPVTYSYTGMETTLGTDLMAGESEYDILAGSQLHSLGMATKGYLLNLAELDAMNANYINLSASYWAPDYNAAINSQGAYYWITGDISLRYLNGMYCTLVNTRLYQDNLEREYGSIYRIVREGKWTIDLMIEMVTQFYVDGGNASGRPDMYDTFGFGYEKNEIIDALAMGMNARFTSVDPESGEISIAVKTEHNKDVASKLKEIADIEEGTYCYYDSDSGVLMKSFAADKLLYAVNPLYQIEEYLYNMDHYTVIPTPKYDENQTKYRTLVQDSCDVFGIVYCSSEVRQAAAALELLCAYSSRDVMPQYYFQITNRRYAEDNELMEMFYIIHGAATTDFGYAWSQSINQIKTLYWDSVSTSFNPSKRRINEWTEALNELTQRLSNHMLNTHPQS